MNHSPFPGFTSAVTSQFYTVRMPEMPAPKQPNTPIVPKYTIDLPSTIIQVVCSYYEVFSNDVISKSRSREFVEPRQIAMKVIKNKTVLSLRAIGELFSGRDHSTVLYSCEVVDELCQTDMAYKKRYHEILSLFDLL